MAAGRHATGDRSAAHPRLAACWLAVAFTTAGAAMGASYTGPTLGSWLLGTVTVGFSVLAFVALLPGGGVDEHEDAARRVAPGVYVQHFAHPATAPGVHWFRWSPTAAAFVPDDGGELDDDVRDDLRQHADEDDPWGQAAGGAS